MDDLVFHLYDEWDGREEVVNTAVRLYGENPHSWPGEIREFIYDDEPVAAVEAV